MREALLFFKGFLANPTAVGSLFPSSRHLVAAMLSEIDFSTARLIVEYGPGTGVFTDELLRRLHPEARLVCIELGDDFHAELKARFSDPRLILIHGSAAEVRRHLQDHGLGAPDTVVSGLPFTSLPADLRHQILRETCQALKPGGLFQLYQYTHFMTGHLGQYFADLHWRWTFRNVPPAISFSCRSPRAEVLAGEPAGAGSV